MDFKSQYKHPRWQKKRLEKLEHRGFVCEICGDSESQLHVHHKQYFKGRMVWEYDNDQLAVLCESCHEELHASGHDLLIDVISRLPLDGPRSRNDVAYLIAGYAGIDMEFNFRWQEHLFNAGAEACQIALALLRENSKGFDNGKS